MEFSPKDIEIVIGLGNPDRKYENTYHNAGHLFADYLQKNSAWLPAPYIVKSGVYMNESGRFAAKEMKKRGVKPEKLLLTHDDSDIELGKYKFSFGRGAAGHHGVESVIKALGTKNFWRLRIGVRQEIRNKRQGARKKAGEFILRKLSADDKKNLNEVFRKINLRLETP